MKTTKPLYLRSLLAVGMAAFPWITVADTTDQKWQDKVVVAKQGSHCVDDPNCFNRYHFAIEPVATASPGQFIVFETRDALDSDLGLDSIADDVTAIDLNLVHPMTGPVHIEGAERGDVLVVELVDIAPDEYGYTVIVPGFGFLRDRYTEPHVVNWKLSRLAANSGADAGRADPDGGVHGVGRRAAGRAGGDGVARA
ncbi:MAG: acetamidase/formamidase family protein [Gammaproteobacteria bacterium]|nr:acetamidase/formamidase family protein [Gammaproteobacteria bacterium]